jgi:hypothetical protein
MKHKVFGTVFVLAVALGMISVSVRQKEGPELRPSVKNAPASDSITRPMATYRVHQESIPGGSDFRGAGYTARVSESGSRFGSKDFSVTMGSPRLEQGSLSLECAKATFSRPAFGVGQLDRGAVIEKYVFENRRLEQIFTLPAPLGEGRLRLSIPVQSDLGGPVITHAPYSNSFTDVKFKDGGIAFCDATGTTKMSYHGAVAIDARGEQLALAPRHENGMIILDVPAAFMARAAYPVVIDPWLDFDGSGVAGGITANTGASENPAVEIGLLGWPTVAWSDNSAGNFDIYVRSWNGFEWLGLSTSDSPGGISNNTGKSVNPSIASRGGGTVVAWEDNTGGLVNIYAKFFPPKGQAGEGAWNELSGSASSTGLSGAGIAQHPSVGILQGIIPGTVTTNPSTGLVSSTPSQSVLCPVVAYDSTQEAGTQIYCMAFYPGQPAHPADPATVALFPLGQAAVPAGWYQMGLPGGLGVDSTFRFPFNSASQTPSGSVALYPSMVVDATNQVAVAWHDTRDGNYEIYCAKYVSSAAPFQVQSDPTLITFNMLPAGTWRDVQNSASMSVATSTGQVFASATPSQYPSLATDTVGGTVNYSVAWQETESGIPLNPGVSSQIYLRRADPAVAAGAWTGYGGSSGPGGISQTGLPYNGATAPGGPFPGNATSPSLDVGGTYMGVAWADDSNSRSSVYVRRYFLNAGALGNPWEQVGFQGSAFPPTGVTEVAPIDGISKSVNFAFQPKVKLDQFGSPVVVWADGAGSQFDVRVKVFSPNGPGVPIGLGTSTATFQITLVQSSNDPTSATPGIIPIGGSTSGTAVWLSSRIFTETLQPAALSLRLELEVQPVGAPFGNSPNYWTLYDTPDSPTTLVPPARIAKLMIDGLPNASYHWQARTSDDTDRHSPWIPFDKTAPVSFSITQGVGGGGGGGAGSGSGGGGSTASKGFSKCGLLGAEAFLLLGALRLLRRRKTAK